MKHTIFRSILISIVFLSILVFPILNGQFNFVRDIANNENRKLSEQPLLDYKHLDSYPHKYESYYNDNFPIRSLLVKYYAYNNLKIFKKSPIPESVIIGKNGWMYLAGREYESYKGINNLTNNELFLIKQELEYRKDYLAKRNCKFYFVVAPAKTSIYPENLENNDPSFKLNSWGEQLINYLNNHCKVKPIDVYTELRNRKSKELLYFKLDNHWNNIGGFYASNMVLKQMNNDDSSIHINNIKDFRIVKENRNIGNIVNMFPNVESFNDFSFELNKIKGYHAVDASLKGYKVPDKFDAELFETRRVIRGSKKKKLLIVSDSFGGYMFPFLAENFSVTEKIFDKWEYKLNESIVENEKPDVFLMIVLESNLRNIIKYRSFKD